MSRERLIYLPLGGAGEVGMNAYVYGYGAPGKERLILVDLGLTFPTMDNAPGVDLVLPDVSWLAENADRLEAIFITHAHEDHVGALAHLWSRLRAPVYARRFTGRLAQMKMEEQGQPTEKVHIVGAHPEVVEVGPFKVSFVPISHSIPETAALLIDTPAGRIVHAADFKLDTDPVVGERFDEAVFARIGDEGVKVLVCDSTNVFVPHAGRSESTLKGPITELVKSAPGMVVATTFASNVARVKTLAQAGHDAGRQVCLLGRAMQRMIGVAQETGILSDMPPLIPSERAAETPGGDLMLIVTGSQGERRAASAQLSRGRYLGLQLREGDLFLFSSKTIPGNERGVLAIINAFSEMGVDVVDDSTSRYHVSGHANRPDLERIHALLKPDMILPNHGEHRMLRAHAKLASDAGIATAVVVNGTMMDVTGEVPREVEQVEAGRLYLDGNVIYGAMDGIVRDRLRMAMNGHVTVTLILEEDDTLGDPWCEMRGLAERGRSRAPLVDMLESQLSDYIGRAGRKTRADDEALEDGLRRVVRQLCMEEIGKKPEVTVVISRLSDE
ncbi:ribonuclease J [Rhodobaculum claviforme]|uniref:MBL fold hydrolase n=1 Tax=Rhodobaculum claviforme TaxID=1549854 RepID=A0A934TMC3_9RHOB|nr:ribonuclease J [Rhodobaculum claviforme]MBK5928774.1 MBL fold hydrolase [Rhodobaculum claviforme]